MKGLCSQSIDFVEYWKSPSESRQTTSPLPPPPQSQGLQAASRAGGRLPKTPPAHFPTHQQLLSHVKTQDFIRILEKNIAYNSVNFTMFVKIVTAWRFSSH